jgi:hypothetical protein
MVDWLWNRKSKPEQAPEPIKDVAGEMPATSSEVASTIETNGTPDYSRIESLTISETTSLQKFAPMLIIGVGAVGHAVLEKLAIWIEKDNVTGNRPVSLLAVELDHQGDLDYEIPDNQPNKLDGTEEMLLKVSTGVNIYPWYRIPENSPRYRPDGRLALFQTLNSETENRQSPLWNTLKNLLQDSHPDIWIVGSTFDPASGLFFDLSHLVRIVSKEQNYVPFTGWMLALPGKEWAYSHQAEAAAFIRETIRLLRHNTIRTYEGYSPTAANYALWQTSMRGDEDASAIILCEPDNELYGQQAADNLITKLGLSLFTFSQAACWDAGVKLRENIRSGRYPSSNPEDMNVSAFGVSVQVVPEIEMKQFVRSRLTREILVERGWGVIQPWSEDQLEDDDAFTRTVLEQSHHPLLVALAGIHSRFDHPDHWPNFSNADWTFAEHLRLRMQHILDTTLPGNGLQNCASLLHGLSNLFQDLDAPFDILQPLQDVVENAQKELTRWQTWAKETRSTFEEKCKAAEQLWHDNLKREVFIAVQPSSAPDLIHQKLTTEETDIRRRARQHVRMGWTRRQHRLELTLDINQVNQENRWEQFRPDAQVKDAVWTAVCCVIHAVTQEPRYWPVSLTAEGSKLPDSQNVLKNAALTLAYHPGQAQQFQMQSHLVLQASGDVQWRSQKWFPSGENITDAHVFSPNFGILLRLTHRIPLCTIQALPRLNTQYVTSRVPADYLHIFRPEQIALAYERAALETVPYRERQSFIQRRLTTATLDLFETQGAVETFIGAWCAGIINYDQGTNAIAIRDRATLVWNSVDNSHLMTALESFVKEKPDVIRRVSALLEKKIRKSGEKLDLEHINKIADWWKSSNPKDQEWYILVQGYTRRKQ